MFDSQEFFTGGSFAAGVGHAFDLDLGGKRGVASLCIGGGEATAVAVELV